MKLLNKFIFIVVSISVFFSPITYGITAEEIFAEEEEKLRHNTEEYPFSLMDKILSKYILEGKDSIARAFREGEVREAKEKLMTGTYTQVLKGLKNQADKFYKKQKDMEDSFYGICFFCALLIFIILFLKIKHIRKNKELNSTIDSYKILLNHEEKKRKILEILLLEEQDKTKFLENLLQKPKNEIELIAYKTFLDTRERETTFGNFKIY